MLKFCFGDDDAAYAEVRHRVLLAFYSLVLPRFPHVHELGVKKNTVGNSNSGTRTGLRTDGLLACREAGRVGGEGCDFIVCVSPSPSPSSSSVEATKIVVDDGIEVIRLYRACVSSDSTVLCLHPRSRSARSARSGGDAGAIKWIPASLNDFSEESMLCAMAWCITILRVELPVWWVSAAVITTAVNTLGVHHRHLDTDTPSAAATFGVSSSAFPSVANPNPNPNANPASDFDFDLDLNININASASLSSTPTIDSFRCANPTNPSLALAQPPNLTSTLLIAPIAPSPSLSLSRNPNTISIASSLNMSQSPTSTPAIAIGSSLNMSQSPTSIPNPVAVTIAPSLSLSRNPNPTSAFAPFLSASVNVNANANANSAIASPSTNTNSLPDDHPFQSSGSGLSLTLTLTPTPNPTLLTLTLKKRVRELRECLNRQKVHLTSSREAVEVNRRDLASLTCRLDTQRRKCTRMWRKCKMKM